MLFYFGKYRNFLWFVFNNIGINENFLLILGIVVYLLCIFHVFWGRYAEGKGKLINLGNKLVRNELKPAEFVRHYEFFKNSNDLVIKKPSLEVLQLVAIAYDLLDDKENVLSIVDEMIDIANDKRKTFANLIKCFFVFLWKC